MRPILVKVSRCGPHCHTIILGVARVEGAERLVEGRQSDVVAGTVEWRHDSKSDTTIPLG